MNKAIKYRLEPNKEQIVLFEKTFGCCRKVWNLMLADRKEAYDKEKKTLLPTPARYKAEYEYLKEVDSLALANVQRDLEQAYKNFFKVKGVGFPQFKAKKTSRKTYTTNNQHGTVEIRRDKSAIRLPKAGEVKAVLHRLPPDDWVLKSATVSRTSSGKYYCSVLFEFKGDAGFIPEPVLNAIGLDYKSDGLYMDSDGNVCGSPRCYRKAQGKLKKEQRKLRHKTRNSNNYEKQKNKIARVHEKISNQRKDFLHKESAAIAKRYDLVAIESLNMKDLSRKQAHNGKATLDNGWGMFTLFLEYKLRDKGGVLIKVDKWFPSSQVCHICGHKYEGTKDLHIRRWVCPQCGTEHNRDLNAAINIREEGIRMYKERNTA